MKPGIHPDYHYVMFEDTSTGDSWITRSTIKSDRTIEVDGQEYPHVILDVCSYSHPFYTGTMKIVDSAGQVERFNRRCGQRTPKSETK
ncbi:MAG: type B 50S ribosomal protein L31 [Ilumatobacteraceae bacterium]|nr:type B 50S ribosomal protein L31 [Ilumatobacteraceae bacterium]